MLLGIESILRQLQEGKAGVDNVYTRAVQRAGQPPGPGAAGGGVRARRRRMARPGRHPRQRRQDSGTLRPLRRPGPVSPGLGAADPAAAVALPLRRGAPGRAAPGGMPPVRQACTPAQPLGPCMVSTEGACAAAYRYER